MSIIESLKKLVDPIAAREQTAELERFRKPARQTAGPPKAFECRVCGYVGVEPDFCPTCLAQTMRPSAQALPAEPAAQQAEPEATEIPIDGTLDLHTMRPKELGELLPEYLQACAARGILQVRVVHGKGTGALRRGVEALLSQSPLVESWRPADESAGGWGATLVTLKQP